MKGIYKITQKSTGKFYIGQSVNIDNRWNQHANAVDNLSFHKAYRAAPTDFTFEIVEQNDNYTKEDLDKAEKRWIINTHADDPKYGFNGTAGNGDYKPFKPIQMKLVSGSINKYIHSEYLKTIENKKILIIGNFKFCDTLSLYNNVTIITDDCDFTCEDAKVIKVSTGEELMGEINKIKKGEYDLVIANPPYGNGNEIVAKFVDKPKESIVLMPISQYKHRDLYKHVLKLNLADPKSFKDAKITDNLCVCKLIDKEIDQTYEEIELQTFNQEYREFYELNSRYSNYAINTYERVPQRAGIKWDYDVNKAFAITARTAQDGVHKVDGKGAFDLDINVYKTKTIVDTPIWKHSDGRDAQAAASYIYFNSTVEKDNLVKFWYYNPLMNKLIKGLNKTGGDFKIAIPNIDWSIDRDYEHCTLNDIMKWLDEDNK